MSSRTARRGGSERIRRAPAVPPRRATAGGNPASDGRARSLPCGPAAGGGRGARDAADRDVQALGREDVEEPSVVVARTELGQGFHDLAVKAFERHRLLYELLASRDLLLRPPVEREERRVDQGEKERQGAEDDQRMKLPAREHRSLSECAPEHAAVPCCP